MKNLRLSEVEKVTGGGLPAVLLYAVARRAVVAGIKHYAKQSAKGALAGGAGGATTAVLENKFGE